MRRPIAAFVLINSSGAIPWWILLAIRPEFRRYFLPSSAPDETILAFAFADLLLYSLGGILAAAGLWRNSKWAWPLLLVHTGAAVYASLYAVTLALLTQQAWWGAICMSPSLLLPYFAFRLRPR